ncbi:MAG TPA: hypothetical protein VK512_21260, partial [Xanthobacteraceae bacterium]|nr:hypothetical protein [Xanthobacteraceae bacterium]
MGGIISECPGDFIGISTVRNLSPDSRVRCVHLERPNMASNARIFFAGVGTSFVILAVGFGGGLMLAKSALHDQPPQMRASSEPTPGMRVILPPSAEPAIQVAERTAAPEPKPRVQPVQELQAPVEQQAEKADPKKAERDLS